MITDHLQTEHKTELKQFKKVTGEKIEEISKILDIHERKNANLEAELKNKSVNEKKLAEQVLRLRGERNALRDK